MSIKLKDFTMKKIEQLFNLFRGSFPSTNSIIRSGEDWENTINAWAFMFSLAELIDSEGNINMDSFNRGIRKLPCLNQKFMPSCGKFIALCIEDEDENT